MTFQAGLLLKTPARSEHSFVERTSIDKTLTVAIGAATLSISNDVEFPRDLSIRWNISDPVEKIQMWQEDVSGARLDGSIMFETYEPAETLYAWVSGADRLCIRRVISDPSLEIPLFVNGIKAKRISLPPPSPPSSFEISFINLAAIFGVVIAIVIAVHLWFR